MQIPQDRFLRRTSCLARALSNPESEVVDSTSAGASILDTDIDSLPLCSIDDHLDDLSTQSSYSIRACTHIIEHLNEKLQEDSFALDKVMCASGESIQTLAPIRKAYEPPNCTNCLPLMFMAMDQPVLLREKGTQPDIARARASNARAWVSCLLVETSDDGGGQWSSDIGLAQGLMVNL